MCAHSFTRQKLVVFTFVVMGGNMGYIAIQLTRPYDIRSKTIISEPVCKPGWFYVTSHGCYNIFWARKVYIDAEQTCIQEGGQLIGWETKTEFEAIRSFLLSTTTCKYPMLGSWVLNR